MSPLSLLFFAILFPAPTYTAEILPYVREFVVSALTSPDDRFPPLPVYVYFNLPEELRNSYTRQTLSEWGRMLKLMVDPEWLARFPIGSQSFYQEMAHRHPIPWHFVIKLTSSFIEAFSSVKNEAAVNFLSRVGDAAEGIGEVLDKAKTGLKSREGSDEGWALLAVKMVCFSVKTLKPRYALLSQDAKADLRMAFESLFKIFEECTEGSNSDGEVQEALASFKVDYCEQHPGKIIEQIVKERTTEVENNNALPHIEF